MQESRIVHRSAGGGQLAGSDQRIERALAGLVGVSGGSSNGGSRLLEGGGDLAGIRRH